MLQILDPSSCAAPTRIPQAERASSEGWTDERVETLKRLWRDGLSASQIARALGGVTRNAVIGKIHRLGLSGSRPAAPRPARPARPRRAPGPRPSASRGIAAPEPEATPVAELPGLAPRLEDLCGHVCHWPIGDPKAPDFAFCGRHAEGPYCVVHTARA